MKYSEELLWILDEPGGLSRTLEAQNKAIQIRKSFAHELKLKCDSVGWCRTDLSDPRTAEILSRISMFCKESGWRARCLYTRKYVEPDSDWYELVPTHFKDNTPHDRIETVTAENKKIHIGVIRAFHEASPSPKRWGGDIYVPERFRSFCLRRGIDDLDFCWAEDKGKYEAEQYFHIYPKGSVPRIAVGCDPQKQGIESVCAAGGWLPEIARVFHELQQVNLQDCYLADDLPDSGIVCSYIPRTFSDAGRHTVLLHKDIAHALLEQKILPPSALRPAAVVKSLPAGYCLKQTQAVERPTGQFMAMMLEKYERLKSTPRPVRMATEKDALKMLRLAKGERKEDFQKGLPKSKIEALLATDYCVLTPYYRVADGGFLSEEYEFLPSANAMKENGEFQTSLSNEELLDAKPDGIVIGRCPDGDAVLLCKDGKVIRFSHEEPVAAEQWPTLAQFFADALNE